MTTDAFQPSQPMTRLMHYIVEHSALDFRLWASMTLLINLDVLDSIEEAEEVATDVISSCLINGRYQGHLDGQFSLKTDDAGEVVDVAFEEVYDDDPRAEAILSAMKSSDRDVRSSALLDLVAATLATDPDIDAAALAILVEID